MEKERKSILTVTVFVFFGVQTKRGTTDGRGYPKPRQYYFGARYYDPETATWGSQDRKGQFYNPYQYTTNPIIYVDEDGNLVFLIPALVFIAKAAAVAIVTDVAIDMVAYSVATGGLEGYMDYATSQGGALTGRSLVKSAAIGVATGGFDKFAKSRHILKFGKGGKTISRLYRATGKGAAFGRSLVRSSLATTLDVGISAGMGEELSAGEVIADFFNRTVFNFGVEGIHGFKPPTTPGSRLKSVGQYIRDEIAPGAAQQLLDDAAGPSNAPNDPSPEPPKPEESAPGDHTITIPGCCEVIDSNGNCIAPCD